MRTRFPIAFLSTVAAVLVLAMPALSGSGDPGVPALAGAQPQQQVAVPDPMTTNVPYLAWRGEQIRFVKCYDAGIFDSAVRSNVSSFFSMYKAQFAVVDWSGDPQFKPTIEDNTVQAYGTRDGICVRGDLTSQYPGLAQVKVVVTDLAGAIVAPKHDFLAIWMTLAPPTLTELPLGGDATTLGIFNPPFANGYMSVIVKGTFPYFGGVTMTMPDQWANLAALVAVDGSSASNPGPLQGAGPPMRWDIHDSLSWDAVQALDGAANHAPGICNGLNAAFDTVDNCHGGYFGTVFGNGVWDPSGPFDPMYYGETLLSDGLLNAGDAPMPAARIDVKLAGTAGALVSADKTVVYSRDHTGAYTDHNVYAPFYTQYIPATSRGDDASGIDGPAAGNNFPGFLVNGLYHNWDAIGQHERRGVNACNDALGHAIPLPTGLDHVVVYTDEHGEAIVGYDPYVGFTLAPQGNNRCYEITKPSTFSSTIQAEAKYPYQPVIGSGPFLSGTLTKTVNTLASKTLSCVPKGTNEMFCVETILDFQGRPVQGAEVFFSRTPLGNIAADAVLWGGFDTRGQTFLKSDLQGVSLLTGANGQAGVLVTESLPGQCVDVKSENVGTRYNHNTGIQLFQGVTPASGTIGCVTNTTPGGGTPVTPPVVPVIPVVPVTPAAPSGGAAGAAAADVPQGTATIVTLPGSLKPTVVAPAATKKAAVAKKATLSAARLITTKTGRYLSVKVASPNKQAQIKVTLLGKNGKIAKVATRTVSANALVRVQNLSIAKAIVKVRVVVLR